jgi:hypothetical protein
VTSNLSLHSLDASLSYYKVLHCFFLLKPVHLLHLYYVGALKRVLIITMASGSGKKKPPFLFFVGLLDSLQFDAGHWAWANKSLLHNYTAQKG